MALQDYMSFLRTNSPPLAESLEESETLEEIEYIFFLKLGDFEQLKNAKCKETQEQWSILFQKEKVENVIRVRRSVKEGEETFTLTSKVNFAELDGKWELEREVDRSHFDQVKDMAQDGLIKERHYFPVDGTDLTWEVDVFYDDQGNPVEWVKLDLEVPKRLTNLPSFPLTHTDVFDAQFEERTAEQHQFVSDLFNKHYSVKR